MSRQIAKRLRGAGLGAALRQPQFEFRSGHQRPNVLAFSRERYRFLLGSQDRPCADHTVIVFHGIGQLDRAAQLYFWRLLHGDFGLYVLHHLELPACHSAIRIAHENGAILVDLDLVGRKNRVGPVRLVGTCAGGNGFGVVVDGGNQPFAAFRRVGNLQVPDTLRTNDRHAALGYADRLGGVTGRGIVGTNGFGRIQENRRMAGIGRRCHPGIYSQTGIRDRPIEPEGVGNARPVGPAADKGTDIKQHDRQQANPVSVHQVDVRRGPGEPKGAEAARRAAAVGIPQRSCRQPGCARDQGIVEGLQRPVAQSGGNFHPSSAAFAAWPAQSAQLPQGPAERTRKTDENRNMDRGRQFPPQAEPGQADKNRHHGQHWRKRRQQPFQKRSRTGEIDLPFDPARQNARIDGLFRWDGIVQVRPQNPIPRIIGPAP